MVVMRDVMQALPVSLKIAVGAGLLCVLGACGGPGPNSPTAGASASNCSAVRKELTKYERRGASSWAEAKSAGKKLSKKKEAGLREYNELLNTYLGNRCHE